MRINTLKIGKFRCHRDRAPGVAEFQRVSAAGVAEFHQMGAAGVDTLSSLSTLAFLAYSRAAAEGRA